MTQNNQAISIRLIKQNDNIQLAQIIRNAFDDFNAPKEGTVYVDPTTDNLFELFQASASRCYVATSKKEILGCCGIYPTENLPNKTAELVKFYLKQSARGKGIGWQLLQQCELAAKELGYDSLYLESLPAFSNSISLYERNGYQVLDKPMGNSGHDGCTIWMIKSL